VWVAAAWLLIGSAAADVDRSWPCALLLAPAEPPGFWGRHAAFVRGASAKETRRIHRRDQYGGEAMLEARTAPLEDPMNDMHLTLAKVEMTRRLADAASRRQRLSATTGRRPVRRFTREARSRLASMP
jgi:hypothetical protein